jgi:hypothetical protein
MGSIDRRSPPRQGRRLTRFWPALRDPAIRIARAGFTFVTANSDHPDIIRLYPRSPTYSSATPDTAPARSELVACLCCGSLIEVQFDERGAMTVKMRPDLTLPNPDDVQSDETDNNYVDTDTYYGNGGADIDIYDDNLPEPDPEKPVDPDDDGPSF